MRGRYIKRWFWSMYGEAWFNNPPGYHVVQVDVPGHGMLYTSIDDRDYLFYIKTGSLRTKTVPENYYDGIPERSYE